MRAKRASARSSLLPHHMRVIPTACDPKLRVIPNCVAQNRTRITPARLDASFRTELVYHTVTVRDGERRFEAK